jgi:hypothetical protein
VYRLKGTAEGARRVFMDYIREINALHKKPEFYNSLTTNCTTNIWTHSLVNPGHVPFSWKILASGYVPEFLYEQGRLDDEGLKFTELQARALVNARAQAAGDAADFSRRIRAADASANMTSEARRPRWDSRGRGRRRSQCAAVRSASRSVPLPPAR